MRGRELAFVGVLKVFSSHQVFCREHWQTWTALQFLSSSTYLSLNVSEKQIFSNFLGLFC